MVIKKKFKIENNELKLNSKALINEKYKKFVLNLPYKTVKEMNINKDTVLEIVIKKITSEKK